MEDLLEIIKLFFLEKKRKLKNEIVVHLALYEINNNAQNKINQSISLGIFFKSLFLFSFPFLSPH